MAFHLGLCRFSMFVLLLFYVLTLSKSLVVVLQIHVTIKGIAVYLDERSYWSSIVFNEGLFWPLLLWRWWRSWTWGCDRHEIYNVTVTTTPPKKDYDRQTGMIVESRNCSMRNLKGSGIQLAVNYIIKCSSVLFVNGDSKRWKLKQTMQMNYIKVDEGEGEKMRLLDSEMIVDIREKGRYKTMNKRIRRV